MKLAYREYGNGNPMIILHGLFGQSDNRSTLARQFSEKNFHVFTVDQRNHGLSPHSSEWNYEVMADDLKEFIDEHQLRQPVLMGHSMGAKTAMFFEWKYPGVAGKIIIADMAAREYPPHHNEVIAALQAVDLSAIKTRKEAEAKLAEYISDFGTRQFLLKNIYWKDAAENRMDWRFNLAVISQQYTNVTRPVPDFKSDVPVLVISGEKSHYINEQDVSSYKDMFSRCTFETIHGAGHWVHAEKPKEYFEVVTRFLGLA